MANPTVWIIRIFKTADGWRALKPLWSKRSGKPLLTQRCLYKETEIDTPGGRWEIEWVEEGKRKRLKCGDQPNHVVKAMPAVLRMTLSSMSRRLVCTGNWFWVLAAGSIGSKLPSSAAPSPSPTLPAVPLRSSYGLMLPWCAWVSSGSHGLSPLSLPTALSARGSFACEPRLKGYASVSCENSHPSTLQGLKEPHQHVQADLPDSFSLPSTSPLWTPAPLDLPWIPPRQGIVIDRPCFLSDWCLVECR